MRRHQPPTNVQSKAHVDLVARHAAVQVLPAAETAAAVSGVALAMRAVQAVAELRVSAGQYTAEVACNSTTSSPNALHHTPRMRKAPPPSSRSHRAQNSLSFWLRLRAAWMMTKLASAWSAMFATSSRLLSSRSVPISTLMRSAGGVGGG